ncbi:integrase arm-type DNA-binding domain-containing protein [Halomonas sp.]|uniref:integrase arm-type DNA-binding domain-containing protein n=1 Tax=Halomonas sp. TaxID=1486246 RepID=UPI00298ECE90|nr:integrase arm-type DNA-binding domain-containing protein [Halomonas sp.]MDW7746830.1 phage integrase Arm DNA-binding domain-containing protein [Halomonas sp.]
MSANNERRPLNQFNVRRLIDTEGWSEVWDTEVSGFHVRKTSKSASYRLSYRHPITHKRHTLTLGRADQIAFRDAKEAAAQTVSMLARQALSQQVEAVYNQCSATNQSS